MGTASYEDFSKLDIRIAEVKGASKVEGADKLLKLRVDIGGEERQIIAGIAQHYKPEKLLRKKIVMIVNLEPAVIRGIKSEGMLLAATDGEKTVLLAPEKEIKPGSKVR